MAPFSSIQNSPENSLCPRRSFCILVVVSFITKLPFLLAMPELFNHSIVVHLRRAGLQGVYQTTLVIYSTLAFIPKNQSLPFLVELISGSLFFSLFLVLEGAVIMVASTIVPSFIISPFSSSISFTTSKNFPEGHELRASAES